ncbi:hypothetical protein TeGR_g9545 [Tetraparma gracilis]|uniref:Uncharacterized protein n=1 Tax=Tetraparma gracilis TaxID=2962635 RepID=A0ABQ6MVF7_9STRA|nr:hypothetical protein TeGR_g9545 [Tetraparma gracilis]
MTDETFEHLTQATTGSTTGNYLVYFHPARPSPLLLQTLSSLFSDEALDLPSLGVVLASLSTTSSPLTASRFSPALAPGLPALLFLARGRLYQHDVPTDEASTTSLAAFLAGGYLSTSSLPIPPPPSFLAALLKERVPPHVLGGGVAAVLLLLVGAGATRGGKRKSS